LSAYYERRKENTSVTFSENNCETSCVMVHPHWHEAGEILLIRHGEGEQLLNTEKFPFRTGDVVWIRGGDVHATTALSAKGCRIDYIKFEEECLLSDTLSLPSSAVFEGMGGALGTCFDFGKKISKTDGGCQMQAAGLLNFIVGTILRTYPSPATENCSVTVQRIREYVENNNDIRLESAAARLGYSPEHISRLFHKETGMTYHAWCERVKMLRAARLLRERTSASQVAQELRYSDESSFIRAFKRHYGMTPCRYRRQKGEPE